jgi:Outer membrane protein beta-barrel domain
MYKFNFRNLFHICCLQIIILFVLGSFATTSFSQAIGRGNYNYLDFQAKPYYFGITLGFNRSDYRIFKSKNFILNDSIAGIGSLRGPGFNLQVVSNLKIGNYFDLRFIPGFSFAEKSVEYDAIRKGRPNYISKIESVYAELPFLIRFKSAPYKDKRIVLLAGFKYAFDIQGNSRSRQISSLIKISPTDFSLEYGVGIQFFLPYFIFSPELKMSQGVSNLLIFKNGLNEATTIDKILSRTLTFSLHFEG